MIEDCWKRVVSESSVGRWVRHQGHTMDHLIDSFFVVLAQIDASGLSFPEGVAAGAVEETAPRAHDGSVDSPLPVVACDGQVGIFASHVESATSVSTTHCMYRSRTRDAGSSGEDKLTRTAHLIDRSAGNRPATLDR